MTSETVLHAASVAKYVTAVAVLHALQQASAEADARIGPFLSPHFTLSSDVADLTVIELLRHESGFPGGDYVYYPIRENIHKVFTSKLPPRGERSYAYSNVNYTIARLVIEAIGNRSYTDYVRSNILEPIGATDMATSVQPGLAVAAAHQMDPGSRPEPVTGDFSDGAGPYGWYATASDLARLGARAASMLSPAMRSALRARELGCTRHPFALGAAYGHDGHWSLLSGAGQKAVTLSLPGTYGAGLLVNTDVGGDPLMMILDGVTASWPQIQGNAHPSSPQSAVLRVDIPSGCDRVYYTTDGSVPNAGSTLYEKPFRVDVPATVRAIATKGGAIISPVVERTVGPAGWSLPDKPHRLTPSDM
jgi:CubicO group peptidase (beta-lactamase class C family)